VGSNRVSVVGGFTVRYQSAAGLNVVIMQIRVEGGRCCIRRVKMVVNFLIV